MTHLVWTKDAPTVEGLYRVRPKVDGMRAVEVSAAFGPEMFADTHDGWTPVSEMNREWAGPIPDPVEAAPEQATVQADGHIYFRDNRTGMVKYRSRPGVIEYRHSGDQWHGSCVTLASLMESPDWVEVPRGHADVAEFTPDGEGGV